jgi:hypothetical protein
MLSDPPLMGVLPAPRNEDFDHRRIRRLPKALLRTIIQMSYRVSRDNAD